MASLSFLSFLVLVLLAGMATSELRGLSPRVAPLRPDVRKRTAPTARSPHLSLCRSCP